MIRLLFGVVLAAGILTKESRSASTRSGYRRLEDLESTVASVMTRSLAAARATEHCILVALPILQAIIAGLAVAFVWGPVWGLIVAGCFGTLAWGACKFRRRLDARRQVVERELFAQFLSLPASARVEMTGALLAIARAKSIWQALKHATMLVALTLTLGDAVVGSTIKALVCEDGPESDGTAVCEELREDATTAACINGAVPPG